MKTLYSYRSNLRPGWAESNLYASRAKCQETMLLEANVVLEQLKVDGCEYLIRMKNPDTEHVVVELVELKDNEFYTVEGWTMNVHFLIEE